METVLGFPGLVGVAMSVGAMLLYLLAGGLYAGTLTDAAQFIYLSLGAWVMVPWAVTNPFLKGSSLGGTIDTWLGEVEGKHSGLYIDQMALLVLGGIPMQSYFQRLFSARNAKAARWMTVAGSLGCLFNAVPAVLIGATAAATEWGNTTFVAPAHGTQNSSLVLPISLSLLVPNSVLFLVLGALVSGLLAAADSTLFGLATMLTHNGYRNWLKPYAAERELIWLARLSVVILASITFLLCVCWSGWHSLWILPYDLLYVLVFPQLFCATYFRYANTIGAFAGLVVGFVLRLCLGEQRLGLPALIKLPFWDQREGQLFPYRTLAMLSNLLVTIVVSSIAHASWKAGKLAASPNDLCCVHKSRRPKDLVASRPEPISSLKPRPPPPPCRWRPPLLNSSADNSFIDLSTIPRMPNPGPVQETRFGEKSNALSRSQAARLLENEYQRSRGVVESPAVQRMTVL